MSYKSQVSLASTHPNLRFLMPKEQFVEGEDFDEHGDRTLKIGGRTLLYVCQLIKTIEQKHNYTKIFSSNFKFPKGLVEHGSIEQVRYSSRSC